MSNKDEFNNSQEFRDHLLDGANYRHPVHTLDDMALLAKQSLARQGVAGYEKFRVEEKPAQPAMRDEWFSQVRSHGGTDYSIFDKVNKRLADEGTPGFEQYRTKAAPAEQEIAANAPPPPEV